MPMQDLITFVQNHTIRGDCRCGQCTDAPAVNLQPQGHTADLEFFKVAAQNSPDVETLRKLIVENKIGAYGDVDPFDGDEHNFIELGGWIGDQGLAMQLMGLGTILGLWQLLTPKVMLPGIPDIVARRLASTGRLTIVANKPKEKPDDDSTGRPNADAGQDDREDR